MVMNPMCGCRHVVAPTPGSAITIPETANGTLLSTVTLDPCRRENQFDEILRMKRPPNDVSHVPYWGSKNMLFSTAPPLEKSELFLNRKTISIDAWLRMKECSENVYGHNVQRSLSKSSIMV
ncbi:hypothetical protein Tco_0212745 [Tanacetum coccineum]